MVLFEINIITTDLVDHLPVGLLQHLRHSPHRNSHCIPHAEEAQVWTVRILYFIASIYLSTNKVHRATATSVTAPIFRKKIKKRHGRPRAHEPFVKMTFFEVDLKCFQMEQSLS